MRRKPEGQKPAATIEDGRQLTVAPTEQDYLASLEYRGADEENLNIISFSMGPRECAFEVSDAVEVLRPRQITEVPRTPAYIKGILSVRGEMVTVIDLRARLGMEPAGASPLSRILIVTVDDLKAGFLVDRLGGVKAVRAASMSAPVADLGVPTRFMKGVVQSSGNSVLLLDAGALIEPDEQQ
jgi:purine-binding chemotaxis protein CheW